MWNKGYIIEIDSVKVGMAKGMNQYISERYLEYDKGECEQKAHVGMEMKRSGTIKVKKERTLDVGCPKNGA